MSDDPYVYPRTAVLRNKLGVQVGWAHTGMADNYRRIVERRRSRELDLGPLAAQMGRTIGDLNFVHPFREGNGRTQLQFARLLVEAAGHRLDLLRLDGEAWMQASREANDARYDAMVRCFEGAIVSRRA